VRVTTVFNRLLALPGISVRGVSFAADTVELTVALRRKRLVCPLCDYATAARRDTRRVSSRWRHLDLGRWRVQVRAELRRIDCPEHGVRG
jgi:transposase